MPVVELMADCQIFTIGFILLLRFFLYFIVVIDNTVIIPRLVFQVFLLEFSIAG